VRTRSASNGVTLNVIAGTNVVLLAFDLTEARRASCMGFAIQRIDHTADEKVWLRGMKTFELTDPGLGPGGMVSTFDHPIQSFQWADYGVLPGRKYTYRVHALKGTSPLDMVKGPPIQATITTEAEAGETHSIYFNRGSVASQAYAREFLNTPPSEFTNPAQKAAAYKFLSRGLEEALLAFIARADGPDFELHCAIYEFRWPSVLEALGAAAATNAKVTVVYDAIPGANKPGAKNLLAIDAAGIGDIVKTRTKGTIMHNKFLVLSKNGVPVAVWTGSTNITEQGIFGHLNLGHVIESPAVAKQYRDYWDVIGQNLTQSPDRQAVAALAARPPQPPLQPITVTFSPQPTAGDPPTAAMLDWYAELAGGAQEALFMTFAFGMNDRFAKLYERKDDVLRLALMETYANGKKDVIAAARKRIEALRKRRNVVVAIGGKQAISGVERWLDELTQITSKVHVFWIHTKFALIDPLGDNPIVITGSANFSVASTNDNHENMLVIAGDKRVADIYFTEYLRLFAHYAFRETLIKRNIWDLADWHPEDLVPNPSWSDDYFKANQRSARRRYYART
jgi:phosphatidylserine/phosphatidylglycerophosphate/cardiolipin synthase-like enzyme